MAKYSRYPKASQPRIFTLIVMIIALLVILLYGEQIANVTAKLMVPANQNQSETTKENNDLRLSPSDEAEPPQESASEE